MDTIDYLSIVVTVIATLIGFYEWHKNKNIKKITDSRRMWRDQLREYVIELEENKNNTDKLRKTLAKIKVRINTLGFNQKFADYKKTKDKINYFQNDGYVWECIQNIDDKIKKNQNNTSGNNGGLYDSEVDKLINCISLLLKSDWDRSKHEIGFVSNQFIFPVVAIVNILNYSYVVYLFKCKEFPIATFWMIVLAISPMVLCLVVYYGVVIRTKKSCKHCEKTIKVLRLLCRILVIVVLFLLMAYVIGDNTSIDTTILNGLCLFTSLVNYIYAEKNICNYLKNVQYVSALEAIMGVNQNISKSELIKKISMLCEKMTLILSMLQSSTQEIDYSIKELNQISNQLDELLNKLK